MLLINISPDIDRHGSVQLIRFISLQMKVGGEEIVCNLSKWQQNKNKEKVIGSSWDYCYLWCVINEFSLTRWLLQQERLRRLLMCVDITKIELKIELIIKKFPKHNWLIVCWGSAWWLLVWWCVDHPLIGALSRPNLL